MSALLKEARKRFKKGDLFLTATGNIKTPLVIHELKEAENYPNMIMNNSENGGGVIYMQDEREVIIEDLDENGEVEFARIEIVVEGKWATNLTRE